MPFHSTASLFIAMMLNFAITSITMLLFIKVVAIKLFKKNNNEPNSLHLFSAYNMPGNVLRDLDVSIHLVVVIILQEY